MNDDQKPYDEINITPMLDVAYVLLIMQGKFVLGCRHHVAGAVQEFFVMRR